ncbi:amidohydrolase family protein [uncultured Tateyamaria sp.]|uniref:amidohydrolase family protein n=1 Tax=uncultured Tateyamaria sp. TaxID=455651 RepID=UPI00262A4256|nr:amidohydrolase family protein [uncultured Tateyamaria sp.]
MKIDAHQHFWQPARGDYDWMPKDDATLSRPYVPTDLAPQLATAGISRSILVQAAATVNETEYMLGLADATETVGAVVGWVDFEASDVAETLARLGKHPKFSGVRPMIQDIPDDDWMLRDDVQNGFRAVCDLGLTFDALGFPRHLANFLTILTRYGDMRCVLDHCMKPDIAGHSPDSFQHWADGMSAIARETGAYCKFSGLVTEASDNWTVDDLRPYAFHIFETFGPDRVMWGSDWPVVRLRAEYDRWLEAAEILTDALTADEKVCVFGGTAAEFYQIDAS